MLLQLILKRSRTVAQLAEEVREKTKKFSESLQGVSNQFLSLWIRQSQVGKS